MRKPSCVQNALLEIVSIALKLKRWCAYADGNSFVAERLYYHHLHHELSRIKLNEPSSKPLYVGLSMFSLLLQYPIFPLITCLHSVL